MSQRFIKFIPSDESNWLLLNHSNAFLLLTLIATRARRVSGSPDGLIIGDALIGSGDLEPGMSRQNFRTAIDKLVEFGYIKIISNGKRFFEREKSTIKVTIKGVLVNLISSNIYDINSEEGNQHINQRVTNDQPTTNHKQERTKNEQESFCKKETSKEKENRPKSVVEKVVNLSPSHKAMNKFDVSDEDVEVLSAWCIDRAGEVVQEQTIRDWIQKFGIDRVSRNVSYVINQGKWKTFGASVRHSLNNDYAKIHENEIVNKEFIKNFKEDNKIVSLQIWKHYCKDPDKGGIDWDFKMNPKDFQRHIEEKYS